MHSDLDITLTFKGTEWVVADDSFPAVSDSLEELDIKVRNHLENRYSPSPGDTITINYLFDNSAIPEWIRQYSNHYFNRKVEFKF